MKYNNKEVHMNLKVDFEDHCYGSYDHDRERETLTYF